MTARTLLAALVLVPTLALAGGPPGLDGDRERHPSPEDRIERLTEKLDLDADQAQAIGVIMEASHEDGKALREDGRSVHEALKAAQESGDEKALKSALKDLENLRADVHDLHESTRSSIKSELTLEQQAEFEQMEMRRHHRQRGGGEGPRGDRERPAR